MRSDVTVSGNMSVGTKSNLRYLTSLDTVGTRRAVWPKTNYFRFGCIRNCTLHVHKVHYKQLGRHFKRFGGIRTELLL